MLKDNPFSLIFGKEPQLIIKRKSQFEEIKDTFSLDNPPTYAYLITGVRGSGKTVLLSSLCKQFENKDDFIVVELNPELDMLEYLASSIYEQSRFKFKFAKKSFSFSFSGLSFSISGDRPISNVITLLDIMLSELAKQNIKVLIAVDDVSNNDKTKALVHQYQIFLRQGYQIFLLMTGLYENIRSLQNEKNSTFLYRTPRIQLDSLSIVDISFSFKKYLNVDEDFSIHLAKLTNGYAYAYQVLGYLCYEHKYISISNDLLDEYDRYLREYVYEKLYSDTPNYEKILLKAIAKSKTNTTEEILKISGFKKYNYSKYRDNLIKKGLLISNKWGTLDFALPRFKEYVLMMIKFED